MEKRLLELIGRIVDKLGEIAVRLNGNTLAIEEIKKQLKDKSEGY